MLKRIDRYILTLFIGYFFGGLIVFATLFWAVDAMSTMVTYKGVSNEVFFRYYLYYLPEVIYKIFPIACLLGTVLTFSNLSKNNEITALFASGMSLLRISMPVLVLLFFMNTLVFFVSNQLLPQAYKQKQFVFYNEIQKKPALFSTIKRDRIWYRSKKAIFNIKTLNVDGTKAQGLTMYFFDDQWNLLELLTAQNVNLAGSHWELENGKVTVFTKESSFPLTKAFQTKKIMMTEDARDIQKSGQTSEMLSYGDLGEFIQRNKKAGLDTASYEVDYHAKIAFAFSGLILSLLGLPFSVGKARSGGMTVSMGIVTGIAFLYWAAYSSCLTLGYHGYLPALVAAWLSNFLGLGLAFYTLKRLKR